jgi:hypothetical protein
VKSNHILCHFNGTPKSTATSDEFVVLRDMLASSGVPLLCSYRTYIHIFTAKRLISAKNYLISGFHLIDSSPPCEHSPLYASRCVFRTHSCIKIHTLLWRYISHRFEYSIITTINPEHYIQIVAFLGKDPFSNSQRYSYCSQK